MAANDEQWECKVMESKEKAWTEKTGGEKALTVVIFTVKIILVLALIYMFIISLGLMGGAFKILGGKTAGATFRNNELFDNPVAGLMMGILATVLVQSSSTSTSIIITMTAAGLMEVKNAIPMIMGANIGTSVTNTIVSLAQAGDKDQYRRAFAGATVHDCFNILTVAILLPIEAVTGLLLHISTGVADATLADDTEKQSKQDFLKKITKPVTSRLVQVDKKLVTKVAEAENQDELDELMKKSMVVNSRTKDNHLFMDTPMSDSEAGWLLLIVSLVFLTTCLSLLVKLLQSVFRGRAAIWMQSLLNLEFKSVPFVGDYVLLAFGIGITILMQSSSITTSTLTPLVGVGLIKLEKMFPFTVGANIGTTVTGIMSALASSNIKVGMTVALAHLFFNLIGTLIWFPLPFMRAVPLSMAKFLGSMAADLRWFPVAYIFVAFAVLPIIFFLLSLAGAAAIGVLGSLIFLALMAAIILTCLRTTRPHVLPESLKRDPAWLPNTLRVQKLEEDSTANAGGAGASAADADLDAATAWWQGVFAWSFTWFVIMLLITGVPNAQWGNMKYAKFDPREHVGIGAWSACSAQYTEQMSWASAPSCTESEANACWSWHMGSCSSAEFADTAGANKNYEKSWENCTAHYQCTPAEWEAACLSASCGGSGHESQCKNLTAAVTRDIVVSYPNSGVAWAEGDACRPLSDVCDNAGTLGHAGNFAVVGLLTAVAGQFCLLAYLFMRKSRDMSKVLLAATGAFALAWVMLLASWAAFASAVGGETTCTIVDVTTRKAALATGSFGEIINGGGSYSYGFVIFSWILLTAVLALVVQRVLFDMKNPYSKQEKAADLASAPAAPEETI